ncbi:uncharacterized protein LOC132276676 [Cornus florida]|uniref:uncharacterized protein LOC132276676 n=1 Tax=Cornus florida TaxID=4283 RepID=UPI002897C5CD|nr:uncharacterized protein LOC132276676 [Cornus florida]
MPDDAMDSTDTDMMESETPPTMTSNSGQGDGGGGDVRGLLSMARQLIDQGKPSQALQAVVMAMRTQGGDGAVSQVLNRAQELYRNRLQASAAADQLASLFAECAIAEALPLQTEPSQPNTENLPMEPDAHGTSILSETGRKQIMMDAFSDGSSFICLQCGGLVSNHRKDEHYAYWCCKI